MHKDEIVENVVETEETLELLDETETEVVAEEVETEVEVIEEESSEEEAEVVAEEVSEEESAIKVEEIDYSEDLDALAADEELSEEFRTKASAIFEAATTAKIASEIDRLEEQYAENLEAEVSTVASDLAEKVDAYLAYVVEQWVEENKVAIENGLRTEIAEDFMTALQGVFKENYIEVPESKVDLVDELADKVVDLEESLNKTTEENIRLSESVREATRTEIVRKFSKDLAATDAEKLAKLVEDVDYVNAETFEMKVSVIAESYFAETAVETVEEEVISDDASTIVEATGPMAAYAAALKTIT
tara:strand:+ start:402 stop:1313 length:912 start_codon:yes stop_codon:yes gene_type:complete